MKPEIKERIECCLTEESSFSNAGNLLHEFKASEIQSVLAFLIEKYERRKFLLEEFWNSKSDACPLECETQEQQIIAFRRFVSL